MGTTKCNPHSAYTVVGFYRDNSQPFCQSVTASNSFEAMRQVVLALQDLNGWGEDCADNLAVVAVLFGCTYPAQDLGEVLSGDKILDDVLASLAL